MPIFEVLWSSDSKRVGIAFRGYFVAAYDRATGKRIQFGDVGHDGYVWHGDYRRCDSEIERFLNVNGSVN